MGARPVPAAHVETSRRTRVRFTGRRSWRGWNGCPHLFPQVFLSALIIAHPTQATWLLLRAALPDSSRAQSQSRGRTPAGCSEITAPITMRGTMILPGETAAGSAGMQPYRGIAWWAHRDDHFICANILPALLPTRIGSVDPHALKTTARRTESTLPENAPSHFTLRRHICSWRAQTRVHSSAGREE